MKYKHFFIQFIVTFILAAILFRFLDGISMNNMLKIFIEAIFIGILLSIPMKKYF